MKTKLIIAVTMLFSLSAATQAGVEVSWDKETTGRATHYELALTEKTTTTSLIVGSMDVPATQTLLTGRVFVRLSNVPGTPGRYHEWIVRGVSTWGVPGPWSAPAAYDLRLPNPPKNLKAMEVKS
jgi:hypothetical protein